MDLAEVLGYGNRNTITYRFAVDLGCIHYRIGYFSITLSATTWASEKWKHLLLHLIAVIGYLFSDTNHYCTTATSEVLKGFIPSLPKQRLYAAKGMTNALPKKQHYILP